MKSKLTRDAQYISKYDFGIIVHCLLYNCANNKTANNLTTMLNVIFTKYENENPVFTLGHYNDVMPEFTFSI